MNSENSSLPAETGAQSQGSESSVARPLVSEAATPAPAADAASGEGSAATGARDEGEAKAAIAQRAEPSIKAERNFFAGKIGRNHEIGDSPVAVGSFDGAAVDPLREAAAALDDRDYATAQRLFEAVGRKDVAEAIKDALAALDRNDFAKAQGLFEALNQQGAAAAQVTGGAAQVKGAAAAQVKEAAAPAHVNESAPASPAPPKPATLAGGPMASDSWNKSRQRPLTSAPEAIPLADAAYRRPPPQAEKAKSRRLKPLFLGAGLVAFAVFGVSAIYGSPLNWTIPVTKSQAIAGLSSGAHILEADLEAVRGGSAREEEPSATRDPNAPLTQLTERLDQIEHEYGAGLDKLGERFDQDPPPDLRILQRGSISWKRKPPYRRRPLRIDRCRGEARQIGEANRRRGYAGFRNCWSHDKAQQVGEESRRRGCKFRQSPRACRAETIVAYGEGGTFRPE